MLYKFDKTLFSFKKIDFRKFTDTWILLATELLSRTLNFQGEEVIFAVMYKVPLGIKEDFPQTQQGWF